MSDSEKVVAELREACVGHPVAKIAWPHRLLHRAADRLDKLSAEVAAKDAEIVSACAQARIWADHFKDAQARARAAEAECAALREAAVGAAAALSAAISLLERTPKATKSAPSDRMFGQMLSDYRGALKATRRALTKEPNNV